jgi:tetratricopeptide (TPR) repeat protein
MAARICLLASVVVSALAAGAIEAAVQEGPTRARAAYDRALALEQAGDHAGALSLLWEAAGLAPRDADILTRLGDALERLGALDAAVDAYRRALAERPDDSRVSDRLILTLVKAGKGDEAVARARTRAAARPEDPGRQFTLGLALAEQDVTAAIATFRRVIELAPRHTLARYNLALVLKRSDRLQDAADELRRSIAIEPRAEAFYTLGVIRWHQGDTDGATDAMREALVLQPRYADAHFTLGAILKETRDWKGAAAALRQAIALRPELWSARYTLARVLELSGDAKAARTELAEAERVRQRAQLEHEALVWTSVGIERLDAGDPARALEHFRRATGAFEAYAPAHYHAGHALARLGRQEEARAAFARARQLNPGLVPPRDAR